MSVNIELKQLVDLALATPEVGAVNFNILRGVLHEILNHLGLSKHAIPIGNEGDFKSAYDFIKEGLIALRPSTPDAPEDEPEEQETEEITETIQDDKSSMQLQEDRQKTPESIAKSAHLLQPVSVHSPKRSIEVLLGKTESLKNLHKKVTDMEVRLDALENAPAPAPSTPMDVVQSAASLVRRDSKTPAHDMVQLINVERRLEAVENSVEGLTEMVDAVTADFRQMKDFNLADVTRIPDIAAELEGFKSREENVKKAVAGMASVKKLESLEEAIERAQEALDELKLTGSSGTNENAVHMKDIEDCIHRHVEKAIASQSSEISGQQVQDVPSETTEIGDILEKLKDQEKAVKRLDSELKKLEKRISNNEREKKNAQELAFLKDKLENCGKNIQSTGNSVTECSKVLGKVRSLAEDNQLQIHQLKGNVALIQQEIQEHRLQEMRSEQKSRDITPSPKSSASTTGHREEISAIRTMIFDLQEEKDNLKKANTQLDEELYKKQKHVDELYSLVEQLQDLKADKDLMSEGFEFKADKREVETKVGREDFDRCMGLVDQSLRDLLQRLDGHEDALKQAIQAVSTDVNKKLDKDQVEPLKEFLEARLKAMRPKPAEKPPKEELAAGFRKALLPNFNCISCARPVKYARDGMFPALPTIQPMPGAKSSRPYTTFELEQIRQHMLQGGLEMTSERFELLEKQRQKLQKEILKLSGARDFQELNEMADRACGGNHTLTYPHSRAIFRGLQFNREEFDFLVPASKDLQAVDILGQDGHIYKGLVDNIPCLPHLPQKPKSAGSRAGSRSSRRSLRRSGTPTPSPAPPQELPPIDAQDS